MHGPATGIGVFIAFIGRRNAKLIVANPATLVGFGRISEREVLLAVAGLLLTAILMARRVSGAILIGMILIAIVGIPLGVNHWPAHLFSLPHPSGTFFKLDLAGATKLGLGELIFVFFFVDLFDNVGTLVGVCEQGRFLRDGKLPRASRALLADAFGTIAGALTGTSTVTSYIESAAGVAGGGVNRVGKDFFFRLFFCAMFFAALVAAGSRYCQQAAPDVALCAV